MLFFPQLGKLRHRQADRPAFPFQCLYNAFNDRCSLFPRLWSPCGQARSRLPRGTDKASREQAKEPGAAF